jgi:anion-transporting  ArsA/GET3 family ATPase
VSIKALLEERRLIVTCGSGGVGKTTTAAAMAVKACLMGKRVAVLTIDPARRLANSLGLKNLDNEAREVPLQAFQKFDLKPTGKLYAAMLDTKRTFDKIIERYAPSEESKQAIFNNSLYQHLSNMIAGSQEYMAMEKIYDLYQNPDYDLLILDTPPTQHALDFLDAPQKMIQAVTDSMLKWFLKPSLFVGRTSLKLLEKGAKKIFKVFDKVAGFDFLQDLSTMLISTAGLLEGFKERAHEVEGLLREPKTAEALYFHQKILEYKLPFAGFIVNRVHENGGFSSHLTGILKALPRLHLSENEKKGLEEILRSYATLVEQDKSQLKLLEEKIRDKKMLTLVPHLDSDVHDLGGLAELGGYL